MSTGGVVEVKIARVEEVGAANGSGTWGSGQGVGAGGYGDQVRMVRHEE
jgi:hypothetical protein